MAPRLPHLVLASALACAGVTSVLAQEPEADPPVRDLEALVDAAERHYPALEARGAAIEAAEARLGEARLSPFFRGWEGTAGLTVVPDATGTPVYSDQDQLPLNEGWGPAAQVGIRGVVPLYTFGKLRALKRAARAGVRAATLDRERAEARLRFDVRRAYFALQLSLDLQQMIGEGLPKLERAAEKLQEMLAEGDPDVNPFDRFRLETALAEVRARASEIERLHDGSEAALQALTGLDAIRVPDCPMEPIALEDTTMARFLEASEARPELGMLEAALEAREAALDAERVGFAPDFGLGFQAALTWAPGRTDQESPFIQDQANRPQLGAGLLMRWNLDFAGQVHRRDRARARLEETRAQAREARLGIRLEVRLAVQAYQDALRREEAWQRGRRQGRAWFVSAAQAYDLGTLEPKDLIDALKAYFTARFSHLQAVRDVNTAAAELERVTGEALLPADGWEPPCE